MTSNRVWSALIQLAVSKQLTLVVIFNKKMNSKMKQLDINIKLKFYQALKL